MSISLSHLNLQKLFHIKSELYFYQEIYDKYTEEGRF